MHEAEDLGALGEVTQSTQAGLVVLEIVHKLLACDVKHENKHFHVLENVLTLRLEVLLHEHVLTAAVPQSQHEVAKEAHSMLINIDCECDAVSVTCQIVRENDTSH